MGQSTSNNNQQQQQQQNGTTSGGLFGGGSSFGGFGANKTASTIGSTFGQQQGGQQQLGQSQLQQSQFSQQQQQQQQPQQSQQQQLPPWSSGSGIQLESVFQVDIPGDMLFEDIEKKFPDTAKAILMIECVHRLPSPAT